MWQQSTKDPMASNVSHFDKYKCQGKEPDSGFLSETSVFTSSEINNTLQSESTSFALENKLSAPEHKVSAVEPMKGPDSGVEVGISDNLNQLCLNHSTLNALGEVHNESLKLTSVSVKAVHQSATTFAEICRDQSQTETKEPWEIYYTQDVDGDTQLHIAVVQGFVEAVICLLNMTPDPCLLDILNEDGQAALHLSVITHQPRIARYLILAGAGPATRNLKGNTALHLACAYGDIECAKALTDPLSPGERNLYAPGKMVPALPQNLEQRNFSGEMCIHMAASRNHVELVRLLLRLGADLDAREGLGGKTPLHLAIENNCSAVLQFLLKECRPSMNQTNYAGLTAYQTAVCINPQLARELVKYGAIPEPISDSDYSDSEDDLSGEDENDYSPHLSLYGNTNVSAVKA